MFSRYKSENHVGLQIICALQQTKLEPNVIPLHLHSFTWSILQFLITELQMKFARVISPWATSSTNPQSLIKSETFLVSPISVPFDFLCRQCERVTKRECSYKIGMAKKKTKVEVCYCSYTSAKMNSLLTHLKSFHFYATVYSATQPRTHRQYLLSMKYFYNETLIFWICSHTGKKYVWY